MWPETIVGRYKTIPCPYDLNASATRECHYTDESFQDVSWGSVDAKACPYRAERSQKIFDLSEVFFF